MNSFVAKFVNLIFVIEAAELLWYVLYGYFENS